MNAHILIVDDECRLAQCLAMTLEDEGYRVSVAHDGVEGLKCARSLAPDLIVLDWNMPQLSGLEVCQHLRQAGNAVPIVLATGRSDRISQTLGLRAGADAYIVKPYNIDEMLSAISQLLDRGQCLVAGCC